MRQQHHKDPADAFSALLGRQATDEERQKLYQVKEALGIRPSDALWTVLIALQYHHSLYEKIPAEIDAASKEAAKTAAMRAQAQVSQAVAQLVPTVQEGVAKAATQAVRQIELKGALGTLFAAAAIVGAVLVIGMMLGHVLGGNAVRLDLAPAAFVLQAGGFAALAMLALGSLAIDYARDKDASTLTVTLCALFVLPVALHVVFSVINSIRGALSWLTG